MLRQNVLANMVGRAWGVLSVYLFLPLFLKLLGAEAYGLVGFYATLMGVLTFADLGLTASLNREMARLSVRDDSRAERADLLRTYETAYAWISLFIVLLIWLGAPLITRHWLQATILAPQEITFVIRLMGISIALQLPSNLYMGGLMGLERQVVSNFLQIGWGLLRGLGAVLILWFLSRTVSAFFYWQLVANIIYCVAARATLWRAVSADDLRPQFRWSHFQTTWRYAMGMLGMSLLATVLMQTDKLAVSRMLPLGTFGYYSLAAALAAVPRMLANPIGSAVFPRMTALVETGDHRGLVEFYHRTARLLAVTVLPGGLTLALFSGDFIFAWTGNSFAAQQVGVAATWLILGEVMQALALPPYYLALAHGDVRLNLQVNSAAVVVITPLLVFLIGKYGATGAGISWVVKNLFTLPPYMYFVHRAFMPGELKRWYLLSIGAPLLSALPWVVLGRWFLPHAHSRGLILLQVSLVWGISTIGMALFIKEARQELIKYSRMAFGIRNGNA